MPVNVGDRLGRYTVLAPLGRGAMGEVYHAHDPRLGRDVAIKLLPAEISAPGERRQRFEREARIVARLNHPNILTLHDVGDHEGTLFLVTELLHGTTLRRRLDDGPLSRTLMARWALELAQGIAAAHELGVVHRDLKPDNIWITGDDRVKILDFGIAKVVVPVDADAATLAAPALTAGQILGTVGYMSPEQVRGTDVDPRSDIFSFGAVLFEMATRRRPFERPSAIEEMHAILHDPPPPLLVATACPAALAAVITRCLEKAPSARFGQVRDLVVALQSASTDMEASLVTGRDQASNAPAASVALDQHIAYCTTRDGVRIAYAVTGQGPLLVRVLGWFTHLEMEWAWPDLRALWDQLSASLTVVRYDGRGIGLSDRWTAEFTEQTRQYDLEAVLDTVTDGHAAALLGISEGAWTAASYAVGHPGRVSHLVFYGGYARGASVRAGYDLEEDRALLTLMRKGWGRETPTFRQVFTSQFYREDTDPELLAYFNELQRASADPDTAARYLESCHSRRDGTDLFAAIKAPTLVIHRRDDRGVAFEEGRYLASVVPGSRFLPLAGSAHYFPTARAAVDSGATELTDAIVRFVASTRREPKGTKL